MCNGTFLGCMTPTALPSWSWRAIPISARASSLFGGGGRGEEKGRGGRRRGEGREQKEERRGKIPGESTKEDKEESNGDM